MAQFSKGTFIYLKLIRSESKNPIYLMGEGVQSAGQYFCNNIINSLCFQLWNLSIGFGRLLGTTGGQVSGLPTHNFSLPANVTWLHDERINLLLLLVSP